MAGSSNRSPSPLPVRPRISSSEAHSAARRSFSGSLSPKPFPLMNPRRSFNPVTPANSPAGTEFFEFKKTYRKCFQDLVFQKIFLDFLWIWVFFSESGRRGFSLPVKEEISSSSWDLAEKENERAAKLRSPAKGSKNFMSPTISAASKICASPKKKVLVDRNEPVRSSITLCDGKATFFSSISSDATEYSKLKPEIRADKSSILGIPDSKEDVLQGPPVAKTLKRVKFAEVPLYCDNVSDSLSETVVTDSNCFTTETCSKNINSCSNLSPSTTIAPLDADPSPSPYDPKTNYLSPRPQFLHYRPNPRIEVLRSMDKGVDMGEPKQLDESFMSEIVSENSDSESQIEDSQKESEDSSSEAEVVVEPAVEESGVVEELKCSEQEVVVELETAETEVVEKSKSLEEEIVLEPETDETGVVEELDSELSLTASMPAADEMAKEIPGVRKQTKLRFYIHSKLFCTIFLLVIACVSISVTDSPILNGYGVKDLKLTNISYLGSQISVLFQSSLNDHFKGSSDFSPMQFIDITADLKGGSKWELEEDSEFKELEEDREFKELEENLEEDELDNDVESEKMLEKVEEDGVEEDVESDVEGSEEEDNPGFGDSSKMEFGENFESEIEVKDDAGSSAKAEEAEFEFEFMDEVEEDVGSAEAEASEGEVYTDFGSNMEMESEESLVLEVEGGQYQKQELIASCYDSVNADDLVAAASSQDFDIKTEAAATPTDVQPEVVEVVKFQGDDNANSHTELETTLFDANLESKIDDSCVEKPSSSEMLLSLIQERSSTLLGISSFILGAVAVAVFIFLKQKNVTPDYVVPAANPCLPKNLISAPAKHIVQEKQSSEDWHPEADLSAEYCPSEMSSFEVSTSDSRKDITQPSSRAQRQDRKPSKSSTRRESIAASSDYSLGSPSHSYGSFTTYERIPIKHVSLAV